MSNKEFSCTECEAEFSIEHDGIDTPMFCPFCSARLNYDDTDLDEDDWFDDASEPRGC